MKKFNKILAMFMTLVMLLSLIPVSALAADPWLEAGAKDEGDKTVVTVKLDAGALADALGTRDSASALIKALIAGVELDFDTLTQVFTVDELFQIIPEEEWLKIFDFDKIVADIGMDKLLSYVDVDALADELTAAEIDSLLKNVSDLSAVVDLEKVIDDIDKDLLLTYIDEDAVFEAADFDEVVNLVLGDLNSTTLSELTGIVDVDKMIEDGVFGDDLEDMLVDDAWKNVDVSVLKNHVSFTNDFNNLSALKKIEFLDTLLSTPLNDTAAFLDTYFDTSAMTFNKDLFVDDADFEKIKTSTCFHITLDTTAAFDSIADADKFSAYNSILNDPCTDEAAFNTRYFVLGVFDHDAFKADVDPAKVRNNPHFDVTVTTTAVFDAKTASEQVDALNALLTAPISVDAFVETYFNTADVTFDEDAFIAAADGAKIQNDASEYINVNKSAIINIVVDGIEDGTYTIESFVDTAKAVNKVKALGAAKVSKYVDKNKAFDLVDIKEAVELLGGYNKAVSYIDISGWLTDPAMSMADVFPAIQISELIDEVGVGALLDTISVKTLAKQFDRNEIVELVKSVDLKSYAKPVLRLIADRVVDNIDYLNIDGYTVAKEDAYGLLSVDPVAFLKAFADMVPTLNEFANVKDGVFFSTNVAMKYTEDGTTNQYEKNVEFVFVVEGDVSRLQELAAKMDDLLRKYIDFEYSNGNLTLGVIMPGKFTNAYSKLLNTDKLSDETKLKLLDMVNADGEKVTGYIEGLEISDIRDMLNALEEKNVESMILQNAYVQKCLEIVSDKIGRDITDLTLDEVYDWSVDTAIDKVPGIERIAAAIEKRIGTEHDILAILQSYNPDELMNAALNKAEERNDLFIKAKNYLLSAMDYIPESVMNTSVMDMYDGNGLFAVSANKTVNAKALLERVLNKMASYDRLDSLSYAIELLMGRINVGSFTMGVNLSLQMTDIYSATFINKKTDTELYKVFLPVGADLSIFTYTDVAGVKLNSWADAAGNAVTTMPAGDIVLYADVDDVVLTFTNNGSVLGTLSVPYGSTLEAYADQLAAFAAMVDLSAEEGLPAVENLYDDRYVGWIDVADTQARPSRINTKAYVATANATFEAIARPNYFLKIADIDYDVELNGYEFVLTIYGDLPEAFVLDLDREHLLTLANDADKDVTLKIDINGTESHNYLTADDATLAQFFGASQTKAEFSYAQAAAPATNSIYTADNSVSFNFDLLVDGNPLTENFAGVLAITLPYANAIDPNNPVEQGIATRIHVLNADGSRELVERIGAGADAFVTFHAPHFSNYVVSNEYLLNLDFVSTVATDPTVLEGILNGYGTDLYFPENAQITVNPVLSNNAEHYTLVKIENGTAPIAAGSVFAMPAASVTFTVTVAPEQYEIHYLINGVENTALAPVQIYYFYEIGNVQLINKNVDGIKNANPAGYLTEYDWAGFDPALLGKATIYVSAKWKAADYFVQFVVGTEEICKIGFTKATADKVVAPTYDMYKDAAKLTYKNKTITWASFNVADAYTAANNTLVVNGTVADATYQITHDGNVTVDASAVAGATVTVTVKAPAAGYQIESVLVYYGAETPIDAASGSFAMPAADAYIVVTYKPMDLSYTIQGGAAVVAPAGTTVTFKIEVPFGSTLKEAPKAGNVECTLVESKLNGTTLELTYAFTLTEDNTAVVYELIDNKFNVIKIFNGQLFSGKGKPVPTHAKALFDKWSESVAGYIQFASFVAVEDTGTPWWLWVVIILLVVILLRAAYMIYLLYFKKKKKEDAPAEEAAEETADAADAAVAGAVAEEAVEETAAEVVEEAAAEEVAEEVVVVTETVVTETVVTTTVEESVSGAEMIAEAADAVAEAAEAVQKAAEAVQKAAEAMVAAQEAEEAAEAAVEAEEAIEDEEDDTNRQ